MNIIIPNLDPVTHYIDFRESVDGIALGTLIATFVYDVRNEQVVGEIRWYKADGAGANDPASGQNQITDAYLDGKTIVAFFTDGSSRPLVNPTEVNAEWDLVAGGGVKLLNDQVFSPGQVIGLWLSYIIDAPGSGAASAGFDGSVVVDHSLTLDSSHFNRRIKCHGIGSRLVIEFPLLADIPDGTPFYFTANKGVQIQTKFVTRAGSGELFEFAGEDVQELTMGKGEFLHIIKDGSRLEVHAAHENFMRVGQRFSGRWKDHLNTLPAADQLLDGDDYPRIRYWLDNKLPGTHKIVTTDALITAFVRPAGKEALFIVASDSRRFRMPDEQNRAERGLKNFTAYNADANRTYDYPGGTMPQQVGAHDHPADDVQTGGVTDNLKLFVKRKVGVTGGGLGLNASGGGYEFAGSRTGKNQKPDGSIPTMNVDDNIGVIYLTCI